jgi:ketosteroid isomerase-like protein
VVEAAITIEDPVSAVREWFEKMTRYCSTVDYESAREICSDEVASFGTKAGVVAGLDRLQKEQWEQVWPRTSGFRVHMDSVRGSGNADIAWGMAVWSSTGYDQMGQEFERLGRSTVVLNRSDGRWLATHTHFSLRPDDARDG